MGRWTTPPGELASSSFSPSISGNVLAAPGAFFFSITPRVICSSVSGLPMSRSVRFFS